MKAQFYRLIGFMLLSGALVFWSFSELADAYERQAVGYQVGVSELFLQLDQQQTLSRQVNAAQLALPPDLTAQLAAGQTIALLQQDQLYYYRQSHVTGLLWQLGPVTAAPDDPLPAALILLAFYAVLVLLLVLLIWPVFRDLHRLQQSAVAFGQDPQPLALVIRRGSSIYPLASAFVQAANQMVSLLALHKNLSRTISHEVRTPLSRMRFALELMAQSAAGTTADNAYLQRLSQDVDDIEQLATNYLAFARLEHHRGSQILKPVVLAEFADDIEQRFALYRSRLRFEVLASDGLVLIDTPALMIAVQNLLMNALRFARRQVSLHLLIDGTALLICVEDDGPGFEQTGHPGSGAFTCQTDFSRQTDAQSGGAQSAGFGLGLYIVRQVASWHQATLTLGTSAVLGGASVRLMLPDCVRAQEDAGN